MAPNQPTFAFFGGEPLGVPALEALAATDLLPNLIVCNPDRPVGRKQVLTPPPVKEWANARGIPVLQPTDYRDPLSLPELTKQPWDVFVVVAYNHILPKWLITRPTHNTLNLHPSLLPQYRGASPIRSAILEDNRNAVGVSIIELDDQMDHGPIVAQEPILIDHANWPMNGLELDALLAEHGGELLANTLPQWVRGELTVTEQDHPQATYCGKLTKAMGEIDINPHHLPTGQTAYQTLCRIRAFAGWPETFFIHHGKRVKVQGAHIANDTLVIERVVPEGKPAMEFATYLELVRE